MACTLAGPLLVLSMMTSNGQGCKTSEQVFSTQRAYFKPGARDQFHAEIENTLEGGVRLSVSVWPGGLLENGGREWDGEEWKHSAKDLVLEVLEEGDRCFRTVPDTPEPLGAGKFSWVLSARPCGKIRLRLRVSGQVWQLEAQVRQEYGQRLARMEDLSLCQFRTQYLRSFPQVLVYPGTLESPTGALVVPVLRATVTDQLTAHYWGEDYWQTQDSICHGLTCGQANTSNVSTGSTGSTSSTVVVSTVKVRVR